MASCAAAAARRPPSMPMADGSSLQATNLAPSTTTGAVARGIMVDAGQLSPTLDTPCTLPVEVLDLG